MELDLQRFYNINRRILMWLAFFAILILLRDFFAVMFLTFIFGFMMRKIARFLVDRTRAPYTPAVVVPYLVVLSLMITLIIVAVPRVMEEGAEFSRRVPHLVRTVAEGIDEASRKYGMEKVLAKFVAEKIPPLTTQPSIAADTVAAAAVDPVTTAPAVVSDGIDIDRLSAKLQETVLNLLPGVTGQEPGQSLPELFFHFIRGVVGGTLQFFLAFLLSFLIVLDFDRIGTELRTWRQSPVGRFFHQATASVWDFSGVVGSAFQCQMVIALLNASVTCLGMFLLGIEPMALLTTIVLLCGLIPVLGVFISSVPIILIAFNNFGLTHAFVTLGMIVVVHMLEAYVFNPRIYAARFHLNPVIVLIILLVAHETFGIWGMLLGIPVTHYVLNIAQMPSYPRKRRKVRQPEIVLAEDMPPPAGPAKELVSK